MPSAANALKLFERWTNSERQGWGWWSMTDAIQRAAEEVLNWADDQGMVQEPEVAAALLTPAFDLVTRIGKQRGKTRCGCGHHNNGDRDPSLAYDLIRGLATCQKTKEVFVVRDLEGRLTAHRVSWPESSKPRVVRGLSLGSDKYTPIEGDKDSALESGSPGRRPLDAGLVNGRLGSHGREIRHSSADNRSAWARWQARRWSGSAGERDAWEAVCYSESTGDAASSWSPDRLYGVGWWPVVWVEWMESKSGKRWPVPHMEERGTGHVLLDIDHVDLLSADAPAGLVDRIRGRIEGLGVLAEVETITRTSSTGLQVLVRLDEFRWDVSGFYADRRVKALLMDAGRRVIEELGSGRVDPAVWRAQSLGRAPGWRVKKGTPELAALWYSIEPRKKINV